MKALRLRSIVISAGCIYALCIAWFSAAVLAFGGSPIQLVSVSAWAFDRYLLAIMIFPCCLFAFIRRRWSTIPLWCSCLWVSFLPLFLTGDAANKWGHPLGFFGRNRLVEIAAIMLLPVFVQIVSSVGLTNRPEIHSSRL